MTAPVKAYIPATGYSTTALVNYPTTLKATANLKSPSTVATQIWGTPMFFNQLGTRFAFQISATANLTIVSNFKRTGQRTISMPQMSRNALYMITNTFPAAYQQVSLRPSVGQLWPRSGAIPF